MHITHSYVGTTIGTFRYLFFALYEDYNDIGREFVREFDIRLERMARELKEFGAVVKPFVGDIDTTRNHVLEKEWTSEERQVVAMNNPAVLVIQVDFDEFSPRSHPWLLLHFGGRRVPSNAIDELDKTLRVITQAALQEDSRIVDLFSAAKELRIEGWSSAFELKPNLFGIGVDLTAAGRALRKQIDPEGLLVGNV